MEYYYICENIPQLIIQIYFAIDVGISKSVNDPILFNAMFFSFVSLLIGILQQISQYNKYHSTLYKEYSKQAVKQFYKMEITHHGFTANHQYSHKTMSKIIARVLNVDETYNVDVYYMLGKREGLIVYFELPTISN